MILRFTFCVLVLALGAGCSRSGDAQFQLNFEGKDRAESTDLQRTQIASGLVAVFGTPDEPYDLNKFVDTGLRLDQLVEAAGPARRTLDGGQRGLYREHCAHCHGVTGDGAGPTAGFLSPYPRDYRKGVFKFTSTGAGLPPAVEDLRSILRQGIPGTAMPSFALLAEDEIDALAQYVKYLALRGQTEESLYDLVVNQEEKLSRDLVVEQLQFAVDRWNEAEATIVQPTLPLLQLADADKDGALSREEAEARLAATFAAVDANGDGKFDEAEQLVPASPPDPALYPAADNNGDKIISLQEAERWLAKDFARSDSDENALLDAAEYQAATIAAGAVLYRDPVRTKCVSCHGPTGLGDGGDVIYDDWNEAKKELDAATIAERFALPRQQLKPRNLRLGIYRGGRRPLDLYRRFHAGIKGAKMPNFGPAPGNAGVLKPEEIWQLVEFVRSLPYEHDSQPPKPSTSVARQTN